MDAEIKTGDDIFVCQLCGECCNGFGGTYVTHEDIINICRFINSEPDTFIKKYCDPSGSRHVLTRGSAGYCVFFDKNRQCTIHPVKPYMCRAWPFIKTLIKNPENLDIMANSCPGIKKGVGHETIQSIVKKEKDRLE
ncbi:MAG: YkgJ family cysteine cluster protein [Desulfobacula sp.]|nr:YkgJ family cysteine cluster protein [Desulfobacula sp.]